MEQSSDKRHRSRDSAAHQGSSAQGRHTQPGARGSGRRALVAHRPTDTPLKATPEELASIRQQLASIEQALSSLFGADYRRGPESERSRRAAADVIDRHFDRIVAEWTAAIRGMLDERSLRKYPHIPEDCANALIRFVENLRDRDNLGTYVYLRRHCQEGMLSRVRPSEFNVLHIALKQIILKRVHAALKGRPRWEGVREAVVAAVDERRLMVSQFYIESREHALRVSEEKYRTTIDHAPDPMYEIEPDTWIVRGANAAAEAMYRSMPDHDSQPLVGRRLTELGPPEDIPHILHHVEKVVREGSDQIRDWPEAGHYFDVNSALISFGKERFVHMILHDVTQRREMLDELLRTERLAAAGTFAAGVAHEVNNPLGSISSLVQSLLPDETDLARRTTLHTILSQITRISTTLKDLVNFARPSASQRGRFDLNELVRETLRLVAYNSRFQGISFDPQLAGDLKPAYADSNEIQQVLINLIFNAADASQHRGGTIRVATENQAGHDHGGQTKKVMMRVTDSGVGIPPENLSRVFDPFFTTKPAGAGVGLGLSLCQRIILANLGTIRIDSEVGRGTSVTICLPTFDSETATAAELVP
ncbi:MAG TPA: ATP-binding protein [Candidatus Binataceae bacterium]|nr:ATP-binding protein [Candidatus Binataceae bacterium]